MNAIADYGSDEDEADVHHAGVASAQSELNRHPAVVSKTISNSTSNSKADNLKNSNKNAESSQNSKKKRKLDISFLPPDIQNALTRGDNLNDSDSDDEKLKQTNNRIDQKHATSKGSEGGVAKQFLSQLPKPKNADEEVKPKNSDLKSSGSTGISFKSNVNISVNSDHSSSEDEIEPKNHLKRGQLDPQSSDEDMNVNNDDSESAAVSSTSTQPVSSNSCASAANVDNKNLQSFPQLLPTVRAAPQINLPAPIFEQQTAPSRTAITYETHNLAQYPGSKSSQANNNFVSQVAATAASQSYGSYSNSKNSNRKRDREIQQQLLSGNVDVVDPNRFVDIVNPNVEWDRTKYNEQLQRQAEVQNMFSFSAQAGNKMISQPTKNQNRKHQINSLAMSAAEYELELMEVRGARAKAKSETQAKYGW
jgi:hypothetical protein